MNQTQVMSPMSKVLLPFPRAIRWLQNFGLKALTFAQSR